MLSEALTKLLMHQFKVSEAGIAALDANNVFLFNNAAFADMFGFSGQSMQGKSHDDMMTWVFQNRVGLIIGCPTLEGWLAHVKTRLRSATFRRFEVDLHDGRWLLVTEQVHPTGELMILCSDITQQKKVEFALKQTQSDLERLALTDDLTAIPNRRHFLQRLGQEFTRARRLGHPLCLAMLDLDHFKRVNDRFGHLGGDEVAILLPETRIEDALCVLRRIGTELGAQRMDLVAPGFTYTFSGGVVEMPDDTGIDYSWMLASADKALYDAKNSGRSRITSFVPLGT